MQPEVDRMVAFLRARQNERRARAAKLLRYAQENDVAVRDPRLLGRHVPGWHEWPEVEQMAREVLADIAAERQIVDRSESVIQGYVGTGAQAATEWLVLRLLAVRHVDHPDYDQIWRPE